MLKTLNGTQTTINDKRQKLSSLFNRFNEMITKIKGQQTTIDSV